MKMNAFNGDQLDTYNLHIIIQEELQSQQFGTELDFDNIKFPAQIKDIHKI